MWRSVVQSTPSLWNAIRFDTKIWNDRSFQPLSERITRFHILSQHLRVTINMGETNYSPQDREYAIFDKRQEDALRAIQNLSSTRYSETGLAFPRILYHLLGTWTQRHRSFNLNLRVAHPEILLAILKAIAAKNLPMPAVNSLTVLDWKSETGGRYPQDDEIDVYGVLSMLPDLGGLWLFDRYGGYTCLFRTPFKGHSPTLHSGLKWFYLEPSIEFEDWIKTLAYWPCLQAACYNVHAPTGTTAAPPQMIIHQHIKELNLQVKAPPLCFERLSLQPFFPLFNAYLPSLKVLNLQFAGHGIDDLRFMPTDFRQAFPSLTHLRIQIRWGQFNLFKSLSTHLLSLPVETTLTIFTSTGDILQLVDALQLSPIDFLQPSYMYFGFSPPFAQRNLSWSRSLEEDFTRLMIDCCQIRRPKTTTIRYEYNLSSDDYLEGGDEIDREAWSDSDSEDEDPHKSLSNFLRFLERARGENITSDEDSEDEERANIKKRNRINKRRRNLKRILACFRSLQTRLGKETVEVEGIEYCEEFEKRQERFPLEWLSPDLKQFRERYF